MSARAMRGGLCALPLLLAALAVSAPARAFVLSEDPLEGDSVSLGANLRLHELVLRGPILKPPLAPPGDNPAALSLSVIRPQFEVKHAPYEFVLHDELSSAVSSVPSALLGSALSLGQGVTAPVWLPLQHELATGSGYDLRERIDWVYARYSTGNLTLTLGRQPVTLGRGRIWTPEDLIAPFSPLQIDTQYKPGADAARIDWDPSDGVTLLLVGSAALHGNSSLLARAEVRGPRLRLGFLAANVRTDVVAGLDFFVDLGRGADLHGEGTSSWVTESARRPWGRHAFSRAVFGSSAELTQNLHVTVEGYWNGAGARAPRDYLVELASRRVALGEAYNAGRPYAGVAAEWSPSPLVDINLAAIANLEYASAILVPTLRYSVAENAQIIAGAYTPLGATPRSSPAGIRAQSEFGLYPELYHVDVKLWF